MSVGGTGLSVLVFGDARSGPDDVCVSVNGDSTVAVISWLNGANMCVARCP